MLHLFAMGPVISWTLVFGSCHHQEMPSPALVSAAASKPDVFVFLGDNVYNDLDASGMPCEPVECRRQHGFWTKLRSKVLQAAFRVITLTRPKLAKRMSSNYVREHNMRVGDHDMEALDLAYATLSIKKEFLALRLSVPSVLATWDDHDFCRNDAGASCPWANRTQAQFLRFWRGDDALSARGGRPGVYEAYTFPMEGHSRTVRVLLLDTRSFRSDHIRPSVNASMPSAASCKPEAGPIPYCQQMARNATLLGEAQWSWLEAEIRVPADVRIIASSISFGAEFQQNGDETWAIFPHEQARLLDLLDRTQVPGVVFISGDLHYGEINEVNIARGAPYTLFDLTSSGLNMRLPAQPNRHRLGRPVEAHNWGAVAVDFGATAADTTIELRLHDAKTGKPLISHSLPLSDLQLKVDPVHGNSSTTS